MENNGFVPEERGNTYLPVPPKVLSQNFNVEDYVRINKELEERKFSPGYNSVAIMVPIPMTKTPGGIIIPDQSVDQEQNRIRYERFHLVVAAHVPAEAKMDITVGVTEIWLDPRSADHSICRVTFSDEIVLLNVPLHAIAAYRNTTLHLKKEN